MPPSPPPPPPPPDADAADARLALVLLLDGGTGHLLKNQEQQLRIAGLPYDQQFLAGAVANAEASDIVRRVHEAYVDAGARVLTTNSFAAAPRAVGLLPPEVRARLWRQLVGDGAPTEDKHDAASTLRLSAELAGAAARVAAEAADASAGGRRPLVAGSLPPLGECCYARPGAPPPPPRAEAARQYLELARAMRRRRRRREQQQTGGGGGGGSGGGGGGGTFPACDLLLAETLPTSEEALAAMDAAAALAREEEKEEGGAEAPALEVWVSFTLCDGGNGGSSKDDSDDDDGPPRLRGGEELEAAVTRLLEHPGAMAATTAAARKAGDRANRRLLSAVLINCCAPCAASAALPVLARLCAQKGLRAGCYCNGFRGTTTEWLCGEAGDAAGLARARAWAEARHRGGARGADFAPARGGGAGDEAAAAAAADTITPEAYARYAAGWVDAGASIVGGCCGVGPEHIERLAALLGRKEQGI